MIQHVSIKTICDGNIGEEQEEWEIEPLDEPMEQPIVEPAPREPVPA